MTILFQDKKLNLIITNHALQRMKERDITKELVLDVLKSGSIKQKDTDKYWIYKKVHGRTDNLICLAIKIEKSDLIVITTLINWEPK
jgi:hypothetical protein